jgi:hypothetical protein
MERETVLDAASIKEIERLAKAGLSNDARVLKIGAVEYSTAALVDLRKPEPEPRAVEMTTLQGLADFARATASGTIDGYAADRDGVFVQVVSPEQVDLCTGIFGEFHQRVVLARSRAITGAFKFGAWLTPEVFTTLLLSQFEPDEDRARVFELTGTVESGASIATADDGVSQMVTVRRGIERRLEAVGPGRMFHLRPFATFAEVPQPRRPFILRMQPGNANAVPPQPHTCALVEADGGRWRLEAIRAIKEWLLAELGDAVPVFG